MNFGFNTNVSVGKSTYHVQSEDRGPVHPFMDTVVYLAGRVVYKRSTGYGEFAKDAPPDSLAARLRELLSQQHRAVIFELEAGTLRMNTTEKREYMETPSEPPASDGLDLRLLNPKSFLRGGQVRFEIALFDKSLKRPVSDAEVQAWVEKDNERTLWMEARTDARGRAKMQFLLPPNAAAGSSISLRATDGIRSGEVRFRLRSKPRGKTPSTSLP